jgi:FkbM family methyltransferase
MKRYSRLDSSTFWKYYGLARSVLRSHANPFHMRQVIQCYRPFVCPGALCFDIGAHVGIRIRAWSRLGARIVALEPQPNCMRFLQWRYGKRSAITLIEQAVGAMSGRHAMLVSYRTATVTPLSPVGVATMRPTPLFAADIPWESSMPVSVTTLDALIAQYGEPAFCRIAVSGFELEVLEGLTCPLRCLSFAYMPAAIDIALGCLERLECLGPYEFNWNVGECYQLIQETWLSSSQIASRLQDSSRTRFIGEVYARLRNGT